MEHSTLLETEPLIKTNDQTSSEFIRNYKTDHTEKYFGTGDNELKFIRILSEKFKQGKFEEFLAEKLIKACNDSDMKALNDSFNCEDKTKFYELDDEIFKKMAGHILADS